MNRLVSLVLIILVMSPVVAAGPIDGSTKFILSKFPAMIRTQEISLSITGIASASDDLTWNAKIELMEMVERLIDSQNPDGGWGYFLKEASNVVDTSYAVIALTKAAKALNPEEVPGLEPSIKKGVEYLLKSRSGEGWGYVSETSPACYPTLMAIWALGESGYSSDEVFIRRAIEYSESIRCEIPNEEVIGLRAIAYHSVGYPVDNSTIDHIKNLLFEENLPPGERALLTYALVMAAPFDFDTYRALTELESAGISSGNTTYWPSSKGGVIVGGINQATSLALMALSTKYERAPPTKFKNPYWMPCDDIKGLQNPDGGWGIILNAPSNEKATYYAINALRLCYPTSKSIGEALNWTGLSYIQNSERALERHQIDYKYFYSLETLLQHGNLSTEDRMKAIQIIKLSQLKNGLWGHRFMGPQPYDTALAIKALIDLGVSPEDTLIMRAKNWLLNVSTGGWGFYSGGLVRKTMFPDILTTITVLEVLKDISSQQELKPHIEWLLKHREGLGWPRYPGGETSLELTIRATELLKDFGYDYSKDTLKLVMAYRDNGSILRNSIETASAIIYLSQFQYTPHVALDDVRYSLDVDTFYLINKSVDNESTLSILESLKDNFNGNFLTAVDYRIGERSYIVLAGFRDYNVTYYNPYLNFKVKENEVIVGNVTVPRQNSVILIPGKTPEGVILFILSEPENIDLVKQIFTTGFIKYIRGYAIVLEREGPVVKLTTLG